MKVLLLGAGASKAYSKSPSGQRMPIAVDFFNTFEKLSISANPWVLREGLFEFLYSIKGVDPYTYLRSGVDIERLHSEIEENLLSKSGGENHFARVLAARPYNELIYIFSAAINEIQNGDKSKAHELLAARLGGDDCVLTFNWDTLMDRALEGRGGWATDFGYGFLPKSVFRDGWVAPGENEKSSGFTRLIKLHGSTNWLTTHPVNLGDGITLMQSAAPDTVWVYEYAENPYDCFAGRFMPGYQPFSFGYYPPNILDDTGKSAPEGHVFVRVRSKVPWKPEGSAGDAGLVSIPLIIPPVRQKKYDLYGPLFDELWRDGRDALRDADHIIIIGYSFPITDIKSAEMFISAFMLRKNMPLISVVDPDPEPVVQKLRFEFGIAEDHIRIYKDYFSEDFDFDKLFEL